ncbi:MAG TPA: hypothetical protein VIJ38_01720 [Acidobacteriaceae bacterium]
MKLGIEFLVCVAIGVIAAEGVYNYNTKPAQPRELNAKAFPLGAVLIKQCNHPLSFYGFDTAGHMYWVDATQMDTRHLMIFKQSVDQNHYMERTVPCIGHYTKQPPTDF